jgi:single-stranded-DNA-specific exonuclease
MALRWEYSEPGADGVIAQIVRNRGVKPEFFSDTDWSVEQTMRLDDLEAAAKRIVEAIRDKERIYIFGDDDPDGITSTHILYDFFERIGSQNHFFHVPNRIAQPHGMQPDFIERMRDEKTTLVITVDVGISAINGVSELNAMGCDVIITDHHLPPATLPEAVAIVDPHISGREYPFRYLAGVGVTLYLIRYLSAYLNQPYPLSYHLWAAIGTIADKAPLIGANRALCRDVFKHWHECQDENLRFLSQYFATGTDSSSRNAFITNVYKLLSCGRRSGGTHLALEMLHAPVCDKSAYIARLMQEKADYDQQTLTVLSHLNELPKEENRLYFLHFDELDRIPRSLLGLAASVVAHSEKIPAIFLKRNGSSLICEARCVDGFNLVTAFTACADLLIQYGGHAKAAGFTIVPENRSAFEKRFAEYISERAAEISASRKLTVDAVVEPKHISPTMMEELDSLQPWGQMNPEPVFLIRKVAPHRQDRFIFTGSAPSVDGVYDIVFQVRSLPFLYVLDYRPSQGA